MKYLTLIFFLSFLITSCSNSNKNSNKKNIKKDTIFIEKEYNKDDKYAVFIAPSKNSEYYDYISDYSFGKFDHQSYKESLDYLKRKKLELSKVSINDFPKNWILLHQYKGKYYVYSPNDYYFHYKIKITNNSYIDFSGEGPSANKILDFKKIDQNSELSNNVEMIQITTADNITLDGWMIKPTPFDETKKYFSVFFIFYFSTKTLK